MQARSRTTPAGARPRARAHGPALREFQRKATTVAPRRWSRANKPIAMLATLGPVAARPLRRAREWFRRFRAAPAVIETVSERQLEFARHHDEHEAAVMAELDIARQL